MNLLVKVLCPKCKQPLTENPKFMGCFSHQEPGCDGLVLSEMGARNMHEALCRQKKMTADQIIREWNKNNPDNKW